MEQLTFFQESNTPLSVSEITAYIRDLMEGDPTLQDVWVQGEVSNISRPKSGHLYFTIKDGNSALRCVMWRNNAARMVYQPQDGDQLEVHGSISVYEVSGQYQLYVDEFRPAGEGLLYQEFQRLKEKLAGEGLFDEERKREIPERPSVIGVVTSPSGAAVRDIFNTLRRRYPLAQVVLAPAAVQGDAAPGEIKAALEGLNEHVKPDVILVGRGGGSIEDLWAFNEEEVARAIAASEAVVISGVGHETDFTIADFAADMRAPTPTAAAELATPDQMELRTSLEELRLTLRRFLLDILNEKRWGLQDAARRLDRRSPQGRLRVDRQRLDDLARRSRTALGHKVRLQRTQLEGLVQQLSVLSPVGVLGRGYAVVTDEDGKVVRRADEVKVGDKVQVRVSDGEFGAQVSEEE